MNFTILSIASIILCGSINICSGEIVKNVIASEEIDDGSMFSECWKKSIKNQTELMDVGSDCHYLILEQLEIKALSDMALMNQHFHYLANRIFRRHFSDRRIVVGSSAIQKLFDSRENFLVVEKNYTESFLKAFGPSIKKVLVQPSFIISDEDQAISKLLNEHCWQTLEDFKLESNVYLLKDVQRPFENVKRATFQTIGTSPRNITFKLNQLFPNLQYMDLKCYGASREGFECNFPYLVDLQVGSGFDPSSYTRLITENPQIRKIRSSYADVEFLHNLNQLLPKLEALDIDVPSITVVSNLTNICFENLKEISIRTGIHKDWFNSVSFKQLESLKIVFDGFHWDSDGVIQQNWIDLIMSNVNLKKLNVTDGFFDDSGLQKLSVPSKLTEVNIICSRDVEESTIMKYLDANSELKIFNLKIVRISPTINTDYVAKFDALCEKLNNEKQIVHCKCHSNSYEINLERN